MQLFEYTMTNRKEDLSSIYNFISSNFYQIDKKKFEKIPNSIILSIISNPNLKLESEDSFLDFIFDIFSSKEEKSCIVDFLENVVIKNLSDEKFCQLIHEVDHSAMTGGLWRRIVVRFGDDSLNEADDNNRYCTSKVREGDVKCFLYSGQEADAFHGIIDNLTKEAGGNVHDKGAVEITESSFRKAGEAGKASADFENVKSYFFSRNVEGSWIQHDFRDKKIRPTHYSIRSTPFGKGNSHFLSWVVEGSNTACQNEWKILDRRNNVTELDDGSVVRTFEIQENLGNNEFYQYIRLRQVGRTSISNFHLGISALEYFGSIK